MRLAELIDEYLLGWILLAVGLGILVPDIAVVTNASTLILAVMVGSVSLTLSLAEFRTVDRLGLGVILLGHLAMPFLAFAIARGLGLSPALTAGFVLLGAVTPELVTPTMTELAGGDTALASTALVVIGVGSTAFIPVVVTFLLGSHIAVQAWAIVEQLLLAVVIPMAIAIAIQERYTRPVARYREYYSSISAIMVVLIIGGVTAENAGLIRANVELLTVVGFGTVALNALGYGLGWIGSVFSDRSTRVAITLSIGMRDFAVAAALLIAAGFPPAASLPAVLFGIVEMVTSTGLARRFR